MAFVHLKLSLLCLVSVALYALLAVRDYGVSELEYWGVWIASFVTYIVSLRLALRSKGSSALVIIFIGAVFQRAALFLGSGIDHPTTDAFLFEPSPLSTWTSTLGLAPSYERVIATACDVAALALAPALLKAARLPTSAAIIHGWNPLVISEVAGAGRIEVLALTLLLLSIRLAQRKAPWPAAIAFGVSLTGPIALAAAVPLMAKALRARIILALGIGLAGWRGALAGMSWAERAGWPPESSVGGSLSPALNALSNLFITRSDVAPVALLLSAWAVLTVVRATRAITESRLPAELLLTVGALLLVSPQVPPMAFVAVGYLGAYSNNRGWVALTATAPLAYLADGSWSFWLGFVQYFTPLALLIFFWLGRPPREAAGKTNRKN